VKILDAIPTYTAPPGGALDDAMLADYRAAGVLILEDFVPVEACVRLRERALELVGAFDPQTVRHVFSTTKQTQLDDRYFYESGDKIRFFLDDSLGFEEPGIIQSMYIFKPPRIGGEVICHQDSTFIYTDPESCIGFWFALEDATLENGCMHFIPGAHKMPLKQLNYRRDDGTFIIDTLDDTPWPEDRKLPAEAKAGTLVIFDGRMPHLSGPNLSDKSRHAYTLHVIDQRCHYPASNWLQRGPDMPVRGFA